MLPNVNVIAAEFTPDASQPDRDAGDHQVSAGAVVAGSIASALLAL
jgi:hypothetical protein